MSLYILNRRKILTGAAAAAVTSLATPSIAQSKLITVIVGFPPGGTPDLIARVVADIFKQRTGRTVVVENRPGANGQIAMQTAKNVAGGTKVVVAPIEAITLTPYIRTHLPYDPMKDFTPLAALSSNAYGLAVGPLAQVTTVADFIAWCKANETSATFGTPGVGTPHHLLGQEFARLAGFKFTHVVYKGGTDVLQDVMGGAVASVISALPLLITRRKLSKLTVLATTGVQRHPILPEVPTFAEAGFPQLTSDGVMGLFTSVNTPKDEIQALSETMMAAVRGEAFVKSVERFGQEPRPLDRATFEALLKSESDRWGHLVAQAGFRPED